MGVILNGFLTLSIPTPILSFLITRYLQSEKIPQVHVKEVMRTGLIQIKSDPKVLPNFDIYFEGVSVTNPWAIEFLLNYTGKEPLNSAVIKFELENAISIFQTIISTMSEGTSPMRAADLMHIYDIETIGRNFAVIAFKYLAKASIGSSNKVKVSIVCDGNPGRPYVSSVRPNGWVLKYRAIDPAKFTLANLAISVGSYACVLLLMFSAYNVLNRFLTKSAINSGVASDLLGVWITLIGLTASYFTFRVFTLSRAILSLFLNTRIRNWTAYRK
jgi:hypothetical protein